MQTSLALVFMAVVAGFILQVCLWRLFRPGRYLVWIPVIFAVSGSLVVAWASANVLGFGTAVSNEQLTAACVLYAVVVACYTGGFAGVVEYSPSAEILRAVAASPQGIRPEDLGVQTLSEAALTGKRIRHLLRNGLVTCDERGDLSLTHRGRWVVNACVLYRQLFGLKQRAAG